MQDPVSITNRSQISRTTALGKRSWKNLQSLSHLLTATWAIATASLVVLEAGVVNLLESQVQTIFFELRGPRVPPSNIVILAIDEASLAQETFYQADPKQYAYAKPIQAWPWQRTAYAQAIDRLMAAGAKSVAVDILFATPSSYGPEDDARLQQTLQRYPGRVTLAVSYEREETQQGEVYRLTYPTEGLLAESLSLGSVNYLLERNQQVHRLGHLFIKEQKQDKDLQNLDEGIQDFATAILQSTRLPYPHLQGSYINFFGPAGAFPQYSFVDVLDPVNWEVHRQNNTFKDKIVLIGATARSLKDFPGAPFSSQPMAGIEIHANAIATLLTNQALAEGIPSPSYRGAFVLLVTLMLGLSLGLPKRAFLRLAATLGAMVLWAGISFVSFSYGLVILPTGMPLLAIALSGLTYTVTGSITEIRSKQQLRRTLQQYSSSPIVQEIISQQEDLKDLLLKREQAIFGKTLGGRYRVIQVLGAGGFGETYVAQDMQRPGYPQCVVKLLRPVSDNPDLLKLAGRMFQREASTLEKLGKHDQIPQLLAYFEEDQEFYLVQELIEGHPLSDELPVGKQIPEAQVIDMLQSLLDVLQFVHQQGVIHRDIKPSNIIRRNRDHQLVLIDFGAVKEIQTLAPDDTVDSRTIGIGTQGYTASEQCSGNPQFNSDIYAVGMTAVRALTGLPPNQFHRDSKTGHMVWQFQAQVSHELAQIINRMIHHDFTRRYQSVDAILADLKPLQNRAVSPLMTLSVPPVHPRLQTTGENDGDTALAPESASILFVEDDANTTIAQDLLNTDVSEDAADTQIAQVPTAAGPEEDNANTTMAQDRTRAGSADDLLNTAIAPEPNQ